MEMAANVRRMRVICSPEREEDVAVAHEPLQPPPKAGVPAVPTTVAVGCSPGDCPPAPGLPGTATPEENSDLCCSVPSRPPDRSR